LSCLLFLEFFLLSTLYFLLLGLTSSSAPVPDEPLARDELRARDGPRAVLVA
jgi:hypothetical protein